MRRLDGMGNSFFGICFDCSSCPIAAAMGRRTIPSRPLGEPLLRAVVLDHSVCSVRSRFYQPRLGG